MQVRFLLGPAGSGKTWRCLEEIRGELISDPTGPPLILLAPKQATFQLERQLLADDRLHGYTRLQILSFDRLADYVLEQLSVERSEMLSEEGRVMVLRALLARLKEDLEMYRSSAQLPGFAQQLSLLLREMHRFRIRPTTLERLVSNEEIPVALRQKLHDIGLIMSGYRDWLDERGLKDVDEVLDMAAAGLRRLEIPSRLDRKQPPPILLAGLWLDGFAEMTPQESDLLAAILPYCERSTLAFCLDGEIGTSELRFSIWNVVGASFRQCRERIEQLDGCETSVEVLFRDAARSRFTNSRALAGLEARWSTDQPGSGNDREGIRMLACDDREAEAQHAARVVRRHIREGGRYRDVALLVRNLDDYGYLIRRVFTRYGIPFFLDQRESAAHHPLAELTRFALRTLVWRWRSEDWFGLLKTGLCGMSEARIDKLENLALARGWEGGGWQGRLEAKGDEESTEIIEEVRAKVILPLKRMLEGFGAEGDGLVSGGKLAAGIREFWNELGVGDVLERWSDARWPGAGSRVYFHEPSVIHRTVWEQMNQWLASIEQAFPDDAPWLTLHEWLPVIETGLANLSVGVIPPAMDQVMVGAVDRTRNPEVTIAIVLGLNEGVFPASPPSPPLLTDAERDVLSGHRTGMGLLRIQQLAHERYLGYIACTRPSRELHLTWAKADDSGRALTWSSIVDHVARLLDCRQPESFGPSIAAADAEHFSEIVPDLLEGDLVGLSGLPSVLPVAEAWSRWRAISDNPPLDGRLLEELFSRSWKTSVSALERFAECPFRFFVRHTLRADERESFEPDVRERGTYQHDVLEEFHNRAMERGGWDCLTPTEGANLVREVAADLLSVSAGGKFDKDAGTRFQAATLVGNLEKLVAAMLEWLDSYAFRPARAELGFGMNGDTELPGLTIPIAEGREIVLRGRIDRIDVLPLEDEPGKALVVIADYKSSGRDLDETKLWNGLQLQLLSYLHVVRHVPGLAEHLDFRELVPAGVFYVGLKWEGTATVARNAGLDDDALRKGFQHSGRFNQAWKELFDNTGGKSGQFKFRGNSPVPSARFEALREQVVEQVRSLGTRILGGEVKPSPYRYQKKTPCDYCECAAVCRFDPWKEDYRALNRPPAKEKA
ncbi:MAG: PD-(D/E)XK nuclease family protein [Verrucomicrobiae bacterium]|nr:PD-(D/E)XK nuclease family protein [Verrucomicrobiae bacterium]